jgi:hypothetical protein
VVPEKLRVAPTNSQVVPVNSRVDTAKFEAVPENSRVVWENPEAVRLNRPGGSEEFPISRAEPRADPMPQREAP